MIASTGSFAAIEVSAKEGFLVASVVIKSPNVRKVRNGQNAEIDLRSMVGKPSSDICDALPDATGGQDGDVGVSVVPIAHEKGLRNDGEVGTKSGEEVHGSYEVGVGGRSNLEIDFFENLARMNAP